MVRGRGLRTYAEERPGAAHRVQVHLTHGLVVEQGHPEERHTQTRTVGVARLLASILRAHYADSDEQLSSAFSEYLCSPTALRQGGRGRGVCFVSSH